MKTLAKRSKAFFKEGSLISVVFWILSIAEKLLRSALLFGSISLIIYLVIVMFQSPETYRSGSFFGKTSATLWGLGVFKAYRNLMYLLMLPYLGLASTMGMIEILHNRVINMVKLSVYVAGILFLITFGYAIAGFITDFIELIIVLNWHLLKGQNLPVGDRPPLLPPFQ